MSEGTEVTLATVALDEADQPAAGDAGPPRRPWRRKIVPYLLIAPTVIYLAMFFAYPMYEGLRLAIYDDEAELPLIDEASLDGDEVARVEQGTPVAVLGQQGNLLAEETEGGDLLTELWFLVEGEQADGSVVEGWVSEARVRVREEAGDGTPIGGTIRPQLAAGADPFTEIRDEPNENAAAVGQLDERAPIDITEVAILEVWFQVRPLDDSTAAGWAPSRFIQVFENGEEGRIDRGTEGVFTTKFIDRMINDRFFEDAVRTTLLLMVLILPIQFVLAMVMALVIHARIRFTSGFLYAFTLPMGMSDLAVGILFLSIFRGNGFLNSILEGLGIIDSPQAFLTAETRNWIIFAIVLAELWRATSIVMVILVSGLQAIPDETLEAAELFGASYWQRVRHVILPLLRPSIQVALILRTILALQVFAVVVALSGGDVVTVLAHETYRQYDDFRNDNVASAYALFILLLSVASAIFYLRAVRAESEVRDT
ncbi:MAG: sugar ABC transporter permease [Ilumatobacter sp.]|uniref:carbohydrate ABC transporter permease n=1 Tax=Ilumatobacter sp. TaxID=1967498 RepID=UPI0026174A64|nr:sugar ABC transporter permease [Ilumatobacter sp.]MDJ0769693.1 sugar ABC transporter permease [Ilumatobacter sp.]